ncbi:MAG: TolC family protein [Flavobacteriales bacterium]|nr:TolC family protein [Flavobacteriales bacterium]
MTFDQKKNRGMSWMMLMSVMIIAAQSQAQRILQRDEFLNGVKANHPSIQAEQKLVDAASFEKQTAWALPNPSIGVQSPTGQFYALGINQNFDFPGVYVARKRMLEANLDLQENVQSLQAEMLLYEACQAFDEGRYRSTNLRILREQDSLLYAILQATEQRFLAGDIDLMEKNFAMLEYGQVHQQYIQAQVEYENALRSIKYYFPTRDSIVMQPFEASAFDLNTPELTLMPNLSSYLKVAEGEVNLIGQQLKVEKNKTFPGIQLGYLNQAGKDTPMNMRWQAGITIPLWFWQYSGNIKAMKAREEAISAKADQAKLAWEKGRVNAVSAWSSSKDILQYHLKSGLTTAQSLAEASERYLFAGEIDYITHLRTLKDVLQYRLAYADAAYRYALATDEVNYYYNQNP